MSPSSRSWLQRFLPLPCCCALCGQTGDQAVCLACRLRYFPEDTARCPRCAIALSGAVRRAPPASPVAVSCGACQSEPPAFDASIAVCDYAAPVDQLVLALKFGAQLALASWFAGMLAQAWQDQPRDRLPTLMMAVPLGAGRLAERGYNQALEIARPLSAMLGVPLAKKLAARTRETAAQTLVPPDQRAANMKAAFMVRPEWMDRVRGQHVAVVDDVMTTGVTLDEMARLLKRHGAARVTNLVFARTPL